LLQSDSSKLYTIHSNKMQNYLKHSGYGYFPKDIWVIVYGYSTPKTLLSLSLSSKSLHNILPPNTKEVLVDELLLKWVSEHHDEDNIVNEYEALLKLVHRSKYILDTDLLQYVARLVYRKCPFLLAYKIADKLSAVLLEEVEKGRLFYTSTHYIMQTAAVNDYQVCSLPYEIGVVSTQGHAYYEEHSGPCDERQASRYLERGLVKVSGRGREWVDGLYLELTNNNEITHPFRLYSERPQELSFKELCERQSKATYSCTEQVRDKYNVNVQICTIVHKTASGYEFDVASMTAWEESVNRDEMVKHVYVCRALVFARAYKLYTETEIAEYLLQSTPFLLLLDWCSDYLKVLVSSGRLESTDELIYRYGYRIDTWRPSRVQIRFGQGGVVPYPSDMAISFSSSVPKLVDHSISELPERANVSDTRLVDFVRDMIESLVAETIVVSKWVQEQERNAESDEEEEEDEEDTSPPLTEEQLEQLKELQRIFDALELAQKNEN